MRRAAATRACQFLWLLLGLTLVVEGRRLSIAGPDVATRWEDPECRPVPGRLPPIHCQDPPVTVTEREFSHPMWTEDPECRPVPGRLPPVHCQDPPVKVTEGEFSHQVTEGDFSHPSVWTEDPDCKPVPGRLPPIHCQDPPVKVTEGEFSHPSMWTEDPECRHVPGRLPPIHCQDPPVKAEGGSIQTARAIEACQYAWQLPGTDCWPPIGQSPRCAHLNGEGCGDSPPTGV